jgi:hypothetical protein
MASRTQAVDAEVSIDAETTRTIEAGRFGRACSENMACDRVADRFYEVHSASGSTYQVDLRTGACECPDCERRGDRFYCKHTIRAALVNVFHTGTIKSEVGALVANHTRENDCTHGNDGLCDGVLGPRLPCPDCCDAVRSEGVDEFDVWTTVVTEAR